MKHTQSYSQHNELFNDQQQF